MSDWPKGVPKLYLTQDVVYVIGGNEEQRKKDIEAYENQSSRWGTEASILCHLAICYYEKSKLYDDPKKRIQCLGRLRNKLGMHELARFLMRMDKNKKGEELAQPYIKTLETNDKEEREEAKKELANVESEIRSLTTKRDALKKYLEKEK